MWLAKILVVLSAVALCHGSTNQLFTEFSNSSDSSRIIGGWRAKVGQFPHQVYLRMKKNNGNVISICGGSLIHTKWVLSAAHCIVRGTKTINVLLGEININAQGIQRTSRSFFIHPDYNSVNFNHDLVLINLGEKVKLSDRIRTIRLPKAGIPNFVGREATVSGFGRTKPSGPYSQYLNYVHVKVIDNSNCEEIFNPGWVIKSTLCAKGRDRPGQTACQGDSGGPLILEGKSGGTTLIGVVSYGRTNCGPVPSGYVQPQYYLKWINSIIRGQKE